MRQRPYHWDPPLHARSAGCQQWVSWARGLVHKMVEGLGYIMPNSVGLGHVDDLSQVVACRSKAQLYDVALRIGSAVGEGVKEADIFLSDTSLMVSNCSTAHVVSQALQAKDISEVG